MPAWLSDKSFTFIHDHKIFRSAGISIRFRTNATHMSVKWTLLFDTYFPHMAPTGIKGVDLYGNINGTWQFIQTGRPKEKTTEYAMLENGAPVYWEYLLNLPLYDGVESLSIGINAHAEISSPQQPFLIKMEAIMRLP